MKRVVLVIGILIAGYFAWLFIQGAYARYQDKALSPESKVRFSNGRVSLSVFYNRPYKKGRKIFGSLVPYGELWRTGANEATVFTNTEDVLVNGKKLEAGRHQVITIPHEKHWTVIFNADVPGWGIDKATGEVYRNVRMDELVFDVPVVRQSNVVEQFTILLSEKKPEIELAFVWDNVRVNVPVAEID